MNDKQRKAMWAKHYSVIAHKTSNDKHDVKLLGRMKPFSTKHRYKQPDWKKVTSYRVIVDGKPVSESNNIEHAEHEYEKYTTKGF